MKHKTILKFIVVIGIMILATILIGATKVQATTEVISKDNKVSTKNEIIDNLVGKIDEMTGVNKLSKCYYLELDTLNLLDLLLDTSKLDSLVQADNYVYQNAYLKLDEDITKVVMGYGCYIDTQDIKKEAKIVTINNVRYAEIPIAVLQKVNGIYNPDIIGKTGSLGFVGTNNYACINLMKNTEILDNIAICSMPSEEEYFKTNGAYIYLTSDTNKDFNIGGQGTGTSGEHLYDRSRADNNCYINVELPIKVGETLELAPFGTLNYKGELKEDYYKYHYQAIVKDKTLFNKDTIICRIVSKDYKLLNMSVLRFQGDLITNKDVKLNDTTTNIKLETTSNVVPENTQLEVKKLTTGNTYSIVEKAINNEVSKFVLYDITLKSNNTTIQPNGKVKISIPIPNGYDTSKIVVYRIAEDGTKTKYDTTINNGYVTFETDHFSNYVVAEETTTTNNGSGTTTEPTEIPKQPTTKPTTSGKLDDTPKTGADNTMSVISSIVSVLSIIGIAIIKKF